MRRWPIAAASALFAVAAVFSAVYALDYKPHARLYSNEIPELRIIGVALSESMENARWSLLQTGKKKQELELRYPVLVDAPAEVAGSSVGISLGFKLKGSKEEPGKDPWDEGQKGGLTYKGSVAELYRLTREAPVNFVLIDRSGRIRALAHSPEQVMGAYANKYAEVIEYLLLNIEGQEKFPYDAASMKTKDLQDNTGGKGLEIMETSLELRKRRAESEAKGPKKGKLVFETPPRIYPLMGELAPDFTLPALDGSGEKSFSELSKGHVTLLVIFWAGGDQSNYKSISTFGVSSSQLFMIDSLYRDFTERTAIPGPEERKDAKPF